MSKQSSVDFLYQSIKSKFPNLYAEIRSELNKDYKQSIVIHRKEIEDAYGHGSNNGYMYAIDKNISISRERYYEQEFQNNN